LRKASAILAVVIFALIVIVVLVIGGISLSSPSSLEEQGLFIASFNSEPYGNHVYSGNFTLVNSSNKTFEGLQLTVKVDDAWVAIKDLRSTRIFNAHDSQNHSFTGNFPEYFTEIDIEPNQNKSIQFTFADSNITLFSQHVVTLYLSQGTSGDEINGQSFIIPQEKAYLQIVGYSSIEHSEDTWHEYYNRAKLRYGYVNDQPNFYQQYHQSEYFPLEPDSYNWAKSLNQIGEHYFNVTVFNNNTFPVQAVTLFAGTPNGDGWTAYASPDKILQPNETYIFPVAVSGENWWSAENVNQLGNFYPGHNYASGDLTSSQT
jgi:hypothetical protein